jgi:AGZA family xanthine/uracil permease-like MFS transporter
LFLLALFFYPLVQMVGGGFKGAEGAFLFPVTAPVMILVGSMMIKSVRHIPWDEPSEAIPAFLIILGMPLTYSIADGLALGFIAYPLLKLCSGKGKEVSVLVYVMAVLLGGVFVLKATMGH